MEYVIKLMEEGIIFMKNHAYAKKLENNKKLA